LYFENQVITITNYVLILRVIKKLTLNICTKKFKLLISSINRLVSELVLTELVIEHGRMWNEGSFHAIDILII